jgi:hypothetical protein
MDQVKAVQYSSSAEDGSNLRVAQNLAPLPDTMNLLCDAISRLTMGDGQLMRRLIQQRELEERGGPVGPKAPPKVGLIPIPLVFMKSLFTLRYQLQ